MPRINFKRRVRKYRGYAIRKGHAWWCSFTKRRKYVRKSKGEGITQTIEDLPIKLSMRKFITTKNQVDVRWDYRYRKNTVRKEIKRMLRGLVGLPWNEVYSKIVEKFGTHKQFHLIDLSNLVWRCTMTKDGIRWITDMRGNPCTTLEEMKGWKLREQYYVDTKGYLAVLRNKTTCSASDKWPSLYYKERDEQRRREKIRLKLQKKYDKVVETYDEYANRKIVNTGSYPFVLERDLFNSPKVVARCELDIIRYYNSKGLTCIVLHYPKRIWL